MIRSSFSLPKKNKKFEKIHCGRSSQDQKAKRNIKLKISQRESSQDNKSISYDQNTSQSQQNKNYTKKKYTIHETNLHYSGDSSQNQERKQKEEIRKYLNETHKLSLLLDQNIKSLLERKIISIEGNIREIFIQKQKIKIQLQEETSLIEKLFNLLHQFFTDSL